MKKNYLLGMVLLFSMQISFAQFTDDMEWQSGNCPSHWYGSPPPANCPIISTSYVHSGTQSGYIPDDGVTDVILDLGNKIFGYWFLEFWMYIPSGKEGYLNIQGQVPVSAGEWVVGNFYFNQDTANPGIGHIDDTANGDVFFNFPHDQWFRIGMFFDLTSGMAAGTWQFWVNDIEVLPSGTPFTNEAGDVATSLGGIDFFSVSSNTEYYFDDFCFADSFPFPSSCFTAGVDEFGSNSFKLLPNPTHNRLLVESVEEISKIKVYSQLGQLLLTSNNNTEIDVSYLSNGLYFIEVETSNGKGLQKFIKK